VCEVGGGGPRNSKDRLQQNFSYAKKAHKINYILLKDNKNNKITF